MLAAVCAETCCFVVARRVYELQKIRHFMPATPLEFKILKHDYDVLVLCAQSHRKFLQQKWVVEAIERNELLAI